MPDLIYPTNAELEEIAQVLIPRLAADRPIFDLFPFENVDASTLIWDQEDNYLGLAQARGLNGNPARISRVGVSRFVMLPGVYGEFSTLDERELTERRQYGTFAQPADVSDMVMREQRRLLERRLDRIEWILWTLLATGTFSVVGPNNSLLHTDAYPIQTYTAGTTWATAATSTPLHDLRQVQLLHRGQSVSFYRDAIAWVNLVTLNNMLANTNNADLYGRRVAGLATVNSPEQLNQLLTMDNLPKVGVYDEGYLDDAKAFHPFIPDNKAVVVGKRTNNAPVGMFSFTRNANNPGMAPGPYMKIVDNGERAVPRNIEIHDGFNGGPKIHYPGAVVLMNV